MDGIDKLLTVKEVSELLGLSDKTVRNFDGDGKLVAIRTQGGHRRYRLSDVLIFQRGFVEFQKGDVVKLNSGGPAMTVNWIGEKFGELKVGCSWFDEKHKLEHSVFCPEMLALEKKNDNSLE